VWDETEYKLRNSVQRLRHPQIMVNNSDIRQSSIKIGKSEQYDFL